MFNFIKEKINELDSISSFNQNFNESEAIVEYAHIFQELDDLSVNGTDEEKTRPVGVDIPIEDDLEIDSVEMNLSDGRITDIPMDATVQESNYNAMKTFDYFYQEAVTHISQFPRESSESVEERRIDYARKNYDKYKNHIVQEGLFGFGKMRLDDDRLPAKVNFDFGPISEDNPNQHYIVKMSVLYEVDKRNMVTKKQLESINIAMSVSAGIGLSLYLNDFLRKKYPDKMKDVKSIWDVLTPVKFIVPIEPVDKYCISFGFECEFEEELLYFDWFRDIKGSRNSGNHKISEPEISKNFKSISDSVINKINTKSKKEYIKESYEMRRPDRFGSIYQEAIDFGDTGDSSTPPENSDNNSEPSVSIDNDSSMDNNPSESSPDGETPTVPVDSNNVSDQIAEKVSEDQQSDSVTDIPIEDDLGDDSNTDESSIDDKLDELDNEGNTDMSLDDESSTNMDVNNMTIEELLEQGSEKLKGMTIQQLKEFLSGDPEQIQEAFILNKKNINKEIDIHLRKTLGILNDNEMKLDDLIKNFKKEGSKLNRVLSKATKMKKVYNDEEINEIVKLNKCLVDLMSIIGSSQDKSYVTTVKRLIQAFTSQSVVVSKIIEKNKTVQESYDVSNKEFYGEGVSVVGLAVIILAVDAAVTATSSIITNILSKKSRNKIINQIQKILGDLKENNNNIESKISDFKKELRELNKYLVQANNSNKYYSTGERGLIYELSVIVVDLLNIINKSSIKDESKKVEKRIEEFIKQCKLVSDYLSDKEDDEDDNDD